MKKLGAAFLASTFLVSSALAQTGPTPVTPGYVVPNTRDPGNTHYDWQAGSASTPLPITSAGSGQACTNVPSQSQLAVTTGTVVTLTYGTCVYATISLRQAAGSCINYSTDGQTAPTTGATGAVRQLCAGQSIAYGGSYLTNFKAIAATATTAIDVEYGQ